MFKKILVPVDFSIHSSFAVRSAADLSCRFGSSVTLLYVYDPLPYAFPAGFLLFTKDQEVGLRRQIDKDLSALRVRAETVGAAHVQTLIADGQPASEIVRCAETGGFDLIVIGTHGRRGFEHALLGSVAERVVRLAPCPVLTVRTPEESLARPEQLWPPHT